MNDTNGIQQICLVATRSAACPVSPVHTDQETRVEERKIYQASLERSTRTARRSLVSAYNFCPHPLLLSHQQVLQLERLNQALSIAITNIVERWWTDKEAALPLRMPLGPVEESLLQWMQKATEEKRMPPFSKRKGVWRPDFLLETPTGSSNAQSERFLICEINARFPFELLPLAAYGHQAIGDIGAQQRGYGPATDPNEIITRVFAMFDPKLPIHLLAGTESSLSLELFILLAEQQTGMKPTVINFSDLRLARGKHSAIDGALYSLSHGSKRPNSQSQTIVENGENLEEIHQIVLQCTQKELLSLPREILRHLALRSVNDMRSVFFVHDKRLLGILLQELDDLVYKHRVLTEEQASILHQGIAPTIIPRSPELKQLILQNSCSKDIKDGLILKPARLGDNVGIIFGRDLTAEQWKATITSLRKPRPEKIQYVIQSLIQQPVFEMALGEERGVQEDYLVGTYHAIDGSFGGLGVWRTGSGRLCSSENGGGSWLVSVLPLLH